MKFVQSGPAPTFIFSSVTDDIVPPIMKVRAVINRSDVAQLGYLRKKLPCESEAKVY